MKNVKYEIRPEPFEGSPLEFVLYEGEYPSVRVSVKWDDCVNVVDTDDEGNPASGWMHFCSTRDVLELSDAIVLCKIWAMEIFNKHGASHMIEVTEMSKERLEYLRDKVIE